MKREIDAIQIAMAAPAKPWYKNVSTLLSVIALIFSFSTTYVSYRRVAAQDIQSARQELRGLLQRLAALPKEQVEVSNKYKDDPGSQGMISSFINQENSLLARNAAEVAKKLPSEAMTATQYFAVATALQSAYDLAGAWEFLERALQATPDFNTEISCLRMMAAMKFVKGDAEGGRAEFQKALAIFSKYPEYDPYTRGSTHVYTEVNWAYSEASASSLPEAMQHLQRADAIVDSLPMGPVTYNLRAHIAQARSRIAMGLTPPNPGGVVPGPVVEATALATPAR